MEEPARPDTESHRLLATALGSATSGMIARIPLHPLDTIKARIQVQTAGNVELRAILAGMSAASFYRGFPIAFLGSAPASVLYFSTYEITKRWADRSIPTAPSALVHLSAGMLAEAVSCVLWVPIDLIKERQQVQGAAQGLPGGGGGPRASGASLVRDILRSEGIAGLYRGYAATLASFGPFSALYFAFYENLKADAERATQTPHGTLLPLPWQVACASGAGASAAVLTSPLDLVKLRLQVQRGAPGSTAPLPWGARYRGMLDALAEIVRREGGVRALFRGVGARVAFHTPSTALYMTLFETCRDAFARALREGNQT